ncbi:MAG TPA: DNA polymerase III subunit gamma/tau [Gammaproteobacteria bacterium]|nr:DNA polymerase III subunit gamma/tau [Gammaproteobacteria bacterium]
MSYLVLARRWRPRSFSEMVGQEHVLRPLVNALDNDRLHHAFLFTGTRGVGKTTIARILAKSLNCEKGVSSAPCGECSACREIDEGRFVDLIEVDAASRTKVEDTRELLENVQYAPTRGRYKVYLIDEVHMLSTHSFNALLKTLEEPPPHVKFLLATTDPQRLPVTVLSRCLQFNLRRMLPQQIAGHLEQILGREEISFQPEALQRIAHAADGSMRDALSLLDQAIAYCGGELQADQVRAMLGTIEQDHIFELLEALQRGDGTALLEAVERLAQSSPDFSQALAELLSVLHRIALLQILPETLEETLPERERYLALGSSLAPEDVQLYYQIALLGRSDLELAPDPRGGFEMIMLRMLAFRPVEEVAVGSTGGGSVSAGRSEAAAAAPATRAAGGSGQSPPAATGSRERQWSETVAALGLKGMALQLALNSVLRGEGEDTITVALAARHKQLLNERNRERLEQALRKHYGRELKLVVECTLEEKGATPAAIRRMQEEQRQRAAEQAIASDANVQSMIEQFDARIEPESVRPVE